MFVIVSGVRPATRNLNNLNPSRQPAHRTLPPSLLASLKLTSKQYVHRHPLDPSASLLTLLPTTPPNQKLAIGTCTSLPPTPQNFTPNPSFLSILSEVYARHAPSDPAVQSQASVFGSPGGFNLSHQAPTGEGAGIGHGGWIHISDLRNPPDYGRIAWPEDIIGSLEVDGDGRFADGSGGWQESGTYRIVTREGILGLTGFMREKVVERLREIEGEMQSAQ
ncbi:hypothetical protein BDU57DRAFT_586259 [Ampelomyces quisqualis]|uniref:Uncharacterized protein n=1 Tax=Ampelomyces quisqualis TaxID=50730 RepID=A0A6A5QQA3_AMPQU|nr:hypothetical protein BDU57DRAFT_586259 [Ampelomyces quisqualis]